MHGYCVANNSWGQSTDCSNRVSRSWSSRNSLQLLVPQKNPTNCFLNSSARYSEREGREEASVCSLHGPRIYCGPHPCPSFTPYVSIPVLPPSPRASKIEKLLNPPKLYFWWNKILKLVLEGYLNWLDTVATSCQLAPHCYHFQVFYMLAVRYQQNFKTANVTSRVILNQYLSLEANFKSFSILNERVHILCI